MGRFAWTQSTQHLELVEVGSGPAPTCEPEIITETEVVYETVYEPEVIDGRCNFSVINACNAGTWAPSAEESSIFVHWECQGRNGGRTDSCFDNKPDTDPDPVHGRCGPLNVVNACAAGTWVSSRAPLPQLVYWECQGLYGGRTVECRGERRGVSPVCGVQVNACRKGLWEDQPDTDSHCKWNCRGYNGYEGTVSLCAVLNADFGGAPSC